MLLPMSTAHLSARMFVSASARRPQCMTPSRVSASRTRRPFTRQLFVVYAEPETKDIDLEKAVKDAQEACDDENSAECATAWDTVEELSAAKAHKRNQQVKSDPLEEYCEDNPETDECRVYED